MLVYSLDMDIPRTFFFFSIQIPVYLSSVLVV
jgi:hypothetical protein